MRSKWPNWKRHDQKYNFLFYVAIILTLISIFKTLFALNAPSPQAGKKYRLHLPGYRVVPVRIDPGRSGRDFSHGPIQHFHLHGKSAGHRLLLMIMPVRSRNEKALQMARMAEFEPKFSLRQRHLRLFVSTTSQGSRLGQQQEVAIGRGPKADHPQVARLQTCLMPGGRAAATMVSIQNHLSDHRAAEIARNPVRARLSRFLGLQPNTRWECLAIQLETSDAPGAETSLGKAWTELVASNRFNL